MDVCLNRVAFNIGKFVCDSLKSVRYNKARLYICSPLDNLLVQRFGEVAQTVRAQDS
jgi:hypothetical protein